MNGGVLAPEELQCHTIALEFLVDLQEVGVGEPPGLDRRWEEQPLERRLVHARRQWPDKTLGVGEADVLANDALGEAERGGDLRVAESA